MKRDPVTIRRSIRESGGGEAMKGTLTGRCPSCGEHHAELCVPHEVRTTGVAWFRAYIDELEAALQQEREAHEREIERLREAVTCGADGAPLRPGMACFVSTPRGVQHAIVKALFVCTDEPIQVELEMLPARVLAVAYPRYVYASDPRKGGGGR